MEKHLDLKSHCQVISLCNVKTIPWLTPSLQSLYVSPANSEVNTLFREYLLAVLSSYNLGVINFAVNKKRLQEAFLPNECAVTVLVE